MSTQEAPGIDPRPREPQDLGFGARVAQQARVRLLNRDGSFNVLKEGTPPYRSLNPYHALLTMSWARFYALVLVFYVATNLAFAAAFLLCGPGALHGVESYSPRERLTNAFFFSVQTLATIGYGRISPEGLAANILVAVEALVGMMGFAIATGLSFARFSRPNARVNFSERAIVGPYRGITGFMFRIINERTSQLIELEATIVFSRMETGNGQSIRRFYPLTLERSSVVFFPIQWVIVHPIDSASPLFGMTSQQLHECDGEFVILLTGTDETFSQTVHTRSSYKPDEVVFGARFADMLLPPQGGMVRVDVRRLHDIEPA